MTASNFSRGVLLLYVLSAVGCQAALAQQTPGVYIVRSVPLETATTGSDCPIVALLQHADRDEVATRIHAKEGRENARVGKGATKPEPASVDPCQDDMID